MSTIKRWSVATALVGVMTAAPVSARDIPADARQFLQERQGCHAAGHIQKSVQDGHCR